MQEMGWARPLKPHSAPWTLNICKLCARRLKRRRSIAPLEGSGGSARSRNILSCGWGLPPLQLGNRDSRRQVFRRGRFRSSARARMKTAIDPIEPGNGGADHIEKQDQEIDGG